ncbi:MAG TPA: hypothetical protein VHA11_14245 [Bryobacteraceae bacterium]|nr:hypothetical protein [Bryobacteraceae bacterium]
MRKELEPYIKLAPFVGVGLVVVILAVAGILYMQRGAHMELVTSIQKIRTLAIDENSSAIVADFRLHNPSDYPFVVGRVEATLVDPSGKTLDGMVISEVDAKQLFQYFPALGQKYNDSLIPRTRIAPRRTLDCMLAVRFELPEKLLAQRKAFRIRVEDVDGPVATVVEGARP